MSHPPSRNLLLRLLRTLVRSALRRWGHNWAAGTLLLLANGQSQLVQAQASVIVSGTVQDEISGESLPGPGATVRVVEESGVGTGVAASGAFTSLPATTLFDRYVPITFSKYSWLLQKSDYSFNASI